MKICTALAWLLSGTAAVLSMGAIVQTKDRPSDDYLVSQAKAAENRAPKIDYPTTDVRGRKIPQFDMLIVMTGCKSCSDFRIKAKTFMDSHPEWAFLVVTPDMVDMDSFLKTDNYYVVEMKAGTKLAELASGVYQR
ncbi:MAG: hypothetical protein JST51_18720 [Armatimonadetes bacterium]|nr:hypothetical protein [Armatimonadota bacterium]